MGRGVWAAWWLGAACETWLAVALVLLAGHGAGPTAESGVACGCAAGQDEEEEEEEERMAWELRPSKPGKKPVGSRNPEISGAAEDAVALVKVPGRAMNPGQAMRQARARPCPHCVGRGGGACRMATRRRGAEGGGRGGA